MRSIVLPDFRFASQLSVNPFDELVFGQQAVCRADRMDRCDPSVAAVAEMP